MKGVYKESIEYEYILKSIPEKLLYETKEALLNQDSSMPNPPYG